MDTEIAEEVTSLELEIKNEPFYISADEQQMEQALINIVKNGIEAVEEKGSVKFVTNTRSRQLIIADNGKGITPEQSEQLFTPFYSTKKDGQGIGLTLVREVLMNHDFEFSLKTPAKRQTEFRSLLSKQ
ncbi:MAG: hypothetical protein JWQ66_3483 [Mucilaginibacter sp.]|nr:hypothetical protein [Mucilaginibacter sp.]